MRKALLLLAAAFALALPGVGSASATPSQPLTITTDGSVTGPSSVAGVWSAIGLFDATGTYTEEFRFEGQSIHVVKTLTSAQGTLVLKAQTLATTASDGMVTFSKGSWQITDATGAYAGLHAGGTPAGTDASVASVVTGAVHIEHAGSGHFE